MAASKKTMEEVERLLKTPAGLLTNIENQRRYIAQLHTMQAPCPHCDEEVSFFEAASEDYELGNVYDKHSCPHCKKSLLYVVPFFAGTIPWHWAKK